MEVSIFGVDFINKEVEQATVASPHVVDLTFDIQNRQGDALIIIYVKQSGYLKDDNLNYIVSSKTGFQVIDEDLSFLAHPLNPQTLELCVELSQAAIAHNRVLALSQNQNTVSIKITFYKRTSELIEIVRQALSATLN